METTKRHLRLTANELENFSVIKYIDKMESQKKYITGRNSESFTDLEEAKKYADKWRDKSISVYQDGKYHSTIHKKDGKW